MQTCWWCMAAEDDEVVTEKLKNYCAGTLSAQEISSLNDDLNSCPECVVEYHRAREGVLQLHKRLWELETTRLLNIFEKMLAVDSDDLFIVDNGWEQPVPELTSPEICVTLRYPLEEVLKYPYLLCCKNLCELVVKFICRMEDLNRPIRVGRKLQGIYLLMVHPNEKVRRWAISVARNLKRVDRDDYYDLQEIFHTMFYVIELGISQDFYVPEDEYCSGKLQRLPSHLYDATNTKNYWLGICMLLTQLNSQAMDSLFMGPERQANIPQCIVHTMTERRKEANIKSDPFWPALHCFIVILDRLGSKIWGQIEPTDAFQAITNAASYKEEINVIRLKTKATSVKQESVDDDNDDMVSCSQIVYDCYQTEQTNKLSNDRRDSSDSILEEMSTLVTILQSEMGQGMRVYGSTFLWLIPFVRSITKLGDFGVVYIGEVIHYLHKEITKSLRLEPMNTCDKVCEFFIRILVDIVELYLRESYMKMLFISAPTWVEIVVQCATLSDGLGAASFPNRRSDINRVTSSSFAARPQTSATRSFAVSQPCMNLIRLLLKEGGRSGTVEDSTRFLDRLNIHMRRFPNTEWSLSESDSEDLQKCLTKLVKSIADRSVTSLVNIPSAPPTPPADTPENIQSHINSPSFAQPKLQYKDAAAGPSFSRAMVNVIKSEPLSDHEDCDDFCDLAELKTKKEPDSSLLISACSSSAPGLKPDLGKIQDIKTSPKDSHEWSSGDPEVEVTRSGLAKKEDFSTIIIISDEEDPIDDCVTGKSCPSGIEAGRVMSAPDSNDSPVRDFDGELSESQVFEFETQEYVTSVWMDPQFNCPDPVKKPKLDTAYRAGTDHIPLSNTEPVQEEEIARACQQVGIQISKQEPTTTSMLVRPNQSTSAEKRDNFVHPKPVVPKSPPKKRDLPDEKCKPLACKKPVLIEPVSLKAKKIPRSRHSVSQDSEKSSGPKPPVTSSSFIPPSTPGPSSSSSVSIRKTPASTPAIVPPKKVRKLDEPVSVAERLGLKKKERKAFDLSQRTLDCLGELRSHGQNLHVEPHQASKRVRSNSKTQQKLKGKSGKKLLASQDMQYFRQSRGCLNKSTPATAVVPKLFSTPKPQMSKPDCALEIMEKLEADLEDDHFLPCSQPDPEEKTDDEGATSEMNVFSDDKKSKAPGSSWEKVGDGNTAPCRTSPQPAGGAEDDDEAWLFYTQNEPTDMELCSQMEDYNDDFFLTQRDPVDMDVDPASPTDNPGEGAYEQTSLQPKTISIQNPLSDDHLFAKPGTLPSAQQKTKPCTTKVFPTSSRSASLVTEMEKPIKPPPAANVAKIKVARKMSMPPPPPPKPPPNSLNQSILRPQNQRPTPYVNTASHPPSYKTYQRPETPVSTKQMSKMDQAHRTQQLDQNFLIQQILKWEYHMFDNFKTVGLPSNLCSLPLKQVPSSYSSYDDYFSVHCPLLLINAFEEMANEWIGGRKSHVDLKLVSFEYSHKTASAGFSANLSPEVKNQWYPKEDDFVVLWLPENTAAYCNDEAGFHDLRAHFGWVTRSNIFSNEAGQPSTLTVTIQTHGNVSSVNKQWVRCEFIGSLVSTLREFRGLCMLRSSMMIRPLLCPSISFFTPCPETLPDINMPEYNRDQVRAISCAVSMIKRQQNTPKILLIHGPPGTGKSKTIVGLLRRILSSGSESNSRTGRLRVLLCAPSNAAIDSLMKKVILEFKDSCKDSARGNCGDINLLRLGNEKTMAEQLIKYSLDQQTKKRAAKIQQISDSEVQRQKEKLDLDIEALSQQCAKTPKSSHEFQQLTNKKICLLKEREKLSRQLKEVQLRNKRQQLLVRVLQDSNVIFCTLSTSGSTILQSNFQRLGPFSCVVVDEAGQAKETETLIPLLYQCPTLILVGDHMQLPPTVVSQRAKDLGYDQSLMARLWTSLHQLNPNTSPCIFLSVQYRMHPDICAFPSEYIYRRELKTDRDTAQKRCSSEWAFEPYRVFDVCDGKEIKDKDSFSNLKEVKLVIMLLKLINERKPVKVGVITPYSAQKRCILRAIAKESALPKNMNVDTVDGFQGREMDCIIVSCVRGSSEMGSIGFLASRQRMNVTITRAKFSLFILGHLRTLREQCDWGALIADAEKRSAIIKANESTFSTVTRKILKRNMVSRSVSHPPSFQQSHIPTHIPTEPVTAASTSLRLHRSSSSISLSDELRDPRLSVRRMHEQDRDRHHQDMEPRGQTYQGEAYNRPLDPRLSSGSSRSSRSRTEQDPYSSYSRSRR